MGKAKEGKIVEPVKHQDLWLEESFEVEKGRGWSGCPQNTGPVAYRPPHPKEGQEGIEPVAGGAVTREKGKSGATD